MHPHFFFPVGVVLPYAGPLAVTDTGKDIDLDQIGANLRDTGWLPCDGLAYPCGQYAQLFGVIGNAFGGDGTSFNVPDMRGRFMRGVSGGTGNDPDSGARTVLAKGGNEKDKVGSLQLDAFQQHEHDYLALVPEAEVQPGEGLPAYEPGKTMPTTSYVADPVGGAAPRTATETRPVNVYFNYIIRYI